MREERGCRETVSWAKGGIFDIEFTFYTTSAVVLRCVHCDMSAANLLEGGLAMPNAGEEEV